jgi:hypothetical protein
VPDGRIWTIAGAGYENEVSEFDVRPPTVTETGIDTPWPAGIANSIEENPTLKGVTATLGFPHLIDTTEDEVKKLSPERVTRAPPPVVAAEVVMLVNCAQKGIKRTKETQDSGIKNLMNENTRFEHAIANIHSATYSWALIREKRVRVGL